MDQKPYLLRAVHQWCTDNHNTPYLVVAVDEHTHVPMQYVQNGQITLNISYEATTKLEMRNDLITFGARFAGKPFQVFVPVANVLSLYARETGEGMAFQVIPLAERAPAAAPVPVQAKPKLVSVSSAPSEVAAATPRQPTASKGFLKLVS